MYSAAQFEYPGQSLEQAQQHKLERICQKLELSAQDHLLEIGCGWGSLAIHAATRHGCRVTTTTLSHAQYTYTLQRVKDLGLEQRRWGTATCPCTSASARHCSSLTG
ncbi:hypothetical protein WR25_00182 [Diploscapter pachys]|uniref:Cyclopropane-fatty-acyl-phospholipid synthase n=1 Tax=Diploscapter pachys TaxID=2018661 RepID=A0A2A2M5H1_9BILA|nr:hypothetical protein WR25_00182 [Diploscapter pachys]